MRLDAVYAALARVPLFSNVRQDAIKLDRLVGALTNLSYKVTIGSSAYVLRLAGDGTSDYIDRSAEEYNARVAAEAGVGAEVIFFDATDGTMVTRFVDGVSMNAQGGFGRDPEAPVRGARALRRVHHLGRDFRSRFDVFVALGEYLDLLRGWRTPLPEGYYEVEQGARAVRLALEASPAPLVPCHNDPWPGNLLDADGRIYLIDWEYSGMNDPMWDLADLSVEAGFGPGQDRAMMEAYYGTGPSQALYSRLELYKAMGDLYWSVWGFVQHATGNPAEDFWSYGLERLGRSRTRMSGADFGRHLNVLRTGDSQLHFPYSDVQASPSPSLTEISEGENVVPLFPQPRRSRL
jgi:thiamine kinase-like enzyme